MQSGMRVGAQKIGQFRVADHVEKEDDQHHGEQGAPDFKYQASPSPAATFLVVEYGLAFRHQDNPS